MVNKCLFYNTKISCYQPGTCEAINMNDSRSEEFAREQKKIDLQVNKAEAPEIFKAMKKLNKRMTKENKR